MNLTQAIKLLLERLFLLLAMFIVFLTDPLHEIPLLASPFRGVNSCGPGQESMVFGIFGVIFGHGVAFTSFY